MQPEKKERRTFQEFIEIQDEDILETIPLARPTTAEVKLGPPKRDGSDVWLITES